MSSASVVHVSQSVLFNTPFERNNGPTAILSHFLTLLLVPVLAHVTRIAHTRLLGPETGWSNGQEEYVARWLMLDVVLLICRTA